MQNIDKYEKKKSGFISICKAYHKYFCKHTQKMKVEIFRVVQFLEQQEQKRYKQK